MVGKFRKLDSSISGEQMQTRVDPGAIYRIARGSDGGWEAERTATGMQSRHGEKVSAVETKAKRAEDAGWGLTGFKTETKIRCRYH